MAYQLDASGTTATNAWVQYDENTVQTPVSFPAGVSNSAAIVASLVCDSRPQPPTAGIRVMNPSAAGFTGILQLADGDPLTAAEAQGFNWRIAWAAFSEVAE